MNRLNQHTQIVAEHLAQYLVELPNIALVRTASPNLALIIENAVSTFDRL